MKHSLIIATSRVPVNLGSISGSKGTNHGNTLTGRPVYHKAHTCTENHTLQASHQGRIENPNPRSVSSQYYSYIITSLSYGHNVKCIGFKSQTGSQKQNNREIFF